MRIDETLKIIETIGRQWPLLLVLFFIVVIIIKWKTIWSFIENMTIKIKRGNTELHFQKAAEKHSDLKVTKDAIDKKSAESVSDTFETKDDSNYDAHLENYFDALEKHNFNEAKKLFEKFNSEAASEEIRERQKLNHFYYRYTNGDVTAKSELENYIKVNNDIELVAKGTYYLGIIMLTSDDIINSISTLLRAIEITQKDIHKAFFLNKLSEAFLKYDGDEFSINSLFQIANEIKNSEAKSDAYKAIAEYYKGKDTFARCILLQKALEFKPNDTDLLFDTAYAFSEVEMYDLVIFLYSRLLRFDPENSYGLNNLGVAYYEFDLKISAVKFFKEAVSKKNSLATSNLANKLIIAGFEEEAEKYLKKGQEFENIHDNVYSSFDQLKRTIENENRKESKLKNNANKKYSFFKSFGNALYVAEKIKLDKNAKWLLNDVICDLKIADDKIEINWEKKDWEHRIIGRIERNALFVTYNKPVKKEFLFGDNKYDIKKYEGYGIFHSKHLIVCQFEIEKQIVKLNFRKKG